jgi:hypothetical protein
MLGRSCCDVKDALAGFPILIWLELLALRIRPMSESPAIWTEPPEFAISGRLTHSTCCRDYRPSLHSNSIRLAV